MSKLHVDEYNQLVGFSHHDGMLLGVRLISEGKAELEMRSTGGLHFRISLQGVHRLVLNNFREGNIVDRFFLWEGDRVPKNLLNKLSSHFEDHDIDLIKSKRLAILSLESSYGAELYSLLSQKGGLDGVLNKISVEPLKQSEK